MEEKFKNMRHPSLRIGLKCMLFRIQRYWDFFLSTGSVIKEYPHFFSFSHFMSRTLVLGYFLNTQNIPQRQTFQEIYTLWGEYWQMKSQIHFLCWEIINPTSHLKGIRSYCSELVFSLLYKYDKLYIF